jgi:hypothetical protein
MTTVTHTQTVPRMTHLRAYLAGTGATGALIGGAIVVFLSLAAFVTFKGMPFGASGDNQGSTYLGSNPGSSAVSAPRAAAAALRAGPGAVGATAASSASGDGAARGGSDALPAAFAPPGGSIDPTGPTDPSSPITSPASPTSPTTSPDAGRAVTGAVQALGQATGTDLPGQTSGATRQLDDEVNGALNGVGGAVGNPRLGDDVGGAVNGLTGSGN